MRKTSSVSVEKGQSTNFPYCAQTVCWVLVTNEGEVFNPFGAEQRRSAATMASQGQATLYIAWPGNRRSDLFEVDEPEVLRQLALDAV